MIAQIQMRRGTTAEWAAASPVVLAEGEPGWDSTLEGMKVGDGSTEWAALPWIDAKNRPDINAATLDGNTIAQIKLLMYPVGSIYESTVSTSPAELFGGTWAAVGAGTFLVAAGIGYTAGSTGGAAQHSHNVSGYAKMDFQIGAITVTTVRKTVPSYAINSYIVSAQTAGEVSGSRTIGIDVVGTAEGSNSLPPYYAVYMWERTA